MEFQSPSGRIYSWNKPNPPTEKDWEELVAYDKSLDAASSGATLTTNDLVTGEDMDSLAHACSACGEASRTVQIFPFFSAPVGSGFDTLASDATQVCNGYVSSGEAATSTETSAGWYVQLTPGTWSMRATHRTDTASGIITVTLDGTALGTIDCYSSPAVQNAETTITGIVSATSNRPTLLFSITTKNASSAAYRARLRQITLWRTA